MKFIYWLERVVKGWWWYLTDNEQTRQLAKDRLYWCYNHRYPPQLFRGDRPKKGCPYRMGGFCGQCGCYLKAKSRIKEETCPINQWPNVKEPVQAQE